MKAVINARYGSADTLEIKDIPRPEIGESEILVQVSASSVTTADWRLRASAFPAYAWLPGRLMFGLFAPRNKVPGSDFAGRVVAKGASVTRFKGGDPVFGVAGVGAHAEYLKIASDGSVALMPAGLDPAGAAALPFGALSALVFLRDFARVQPGQRVLIHGASGGLGVYLVQLARHFGAQVTGVSSAANMALVRDLGAHHVIDYATEDFTRGGKTYDLIVDTVGKTTFRRSKRALTAKGIYLPIEFKLREIVQSLLTRLTGGRRVVIGISGDRLEDLLLLRELVDNGALRPVIDQTFPLERVADAHRRVESRHKTGAVIVEPSPALQAAA